MPKIGKEFEANIQKTFGLKDVKLKACHVPAQTDASMCVVIAMMAIYQIYIQDKSIKKMYSPSNDQKFRELFYHTIFNSMVVMMKKTKEIMDKEDKERKI